jgi:putative toxin-antitoxin system antitoxin component (TIGR02293 family)
MQDIAVEPEAKQGSAQTLEPIVEILGGPRVLKERLEGPLDVHDLLLRGLPGAALAHLVDSFALLHDPMSLEKAVGISVRTIQRRKGAPGKPLSQEQSGRTWKFAEIPERWFERPAVGLDHRRPIDLLATTAGVGIVEDHLERLEYGVYT